MFQLAYSRVQSGNPTSLLVVVVRSHEIDWEGQKSVDRNKPTVSEKLPKPTSNSHGELLLLRPDYGEHVLDSGVAALFRNRHSAA